MHNYAAKIQDAAFSDEAVFALKNDVLLSYDIREAFPYFNL